MTNSVVDAEPTESWKICSEV